MTDSFQLLSSFPSRRLKIEEIETLDEHSRIEAVLHDDRMTEPIGTEVFVQNCIFITQNGVHAVVYEEDDGGWQRVHHESRPEATLTDAYDAVRKFHQREDLFTRAPLSVSEVVYIRTHLGDHEEEYAEGDEFDCPVCGEVHLVKRYKEDDTFSGELQDLDIDPLYVECPDARNGQLPV